MRFWSQNKLLNVRWHMFSLPMKLMVLPGNYSFLNLAFKLTDLSCLATTELEIAFSCRNQTHLVLTKFVGERAIKGSYMATSVEILKKQDKATDSNISTTKWMALTSFILEGIELLILEPLTLWSWWCSHCAFHVSWEFSQMLQIAPINFVASCYLKNV